VYRQGALTEDEVGVKVQLEVVMTRSKGERVVEIVDASTLPSPGLAQACPCHYLSATKRIIFGLKFKLAIPCCVCVGQIKGRGSTRVNNNWKATVLHCNQCNLSLVQNGDGELTANRIP
jgi:hypothetical protein